MLQNIGTTELIIILVVLLLLFGGKKLPELGRGLGEAAHELKKAISGDSDSKKSKSDEEE